MGFRQGDLTGMASGDQSKRVGRMNDGFRGTRAAPHVTLRDVLR